MPSGYFPTGKENNSYYYPFQGEKLIYWQRFEEKVDDHRSRLYNTHQKQDLLKDKP